MRAELSLALMLCAAACSSNDSPKHTEPPPEHTLRDDAGVKHVTAPLDPSGMHLDDGEGTHFVAPPQQPNRPAHPIDVTLRSSPPGALVSVDGQPLGNTPAYWSGTADGHEHEFLFTLRGYGIARYRFVPVTSGVIHARLEPIAEEVDAGVAPPPELVPPQPTQPKIAPPPAPAIVKPSEPAPSPDATNAPVDAGAPVEQMPGLGPTP